MKSRILILIGVVAIATLSFTFSTAKNEKARNPETEGKASNNEPIGGFLSQDEF